MQNKKEQKEFIVDLNNKTLGRAASETAKILRGKHLASFEPNKSPGIILKAINLSGIKIAEKKLKSKTLKHYSGYPGGLKKISLEKYFSENPSGIFLKAVKGMLPKNKLSKYLLKQITISK